MVSVPDITSQEQGTGRVATPSGQTHTHIAAAHNRSTVFARLRLCARYTHLIRVLGPTPLTIPDGSSIVSAVFARPVPHFPRTLHCTTLLPQICHYYAGSGYINHSLIQPDHDVCYYDSPPHAAFRWNQPFFDNTRSCRYQRTDRPTDKTTTELTCRLQNRQLKMWDATTLTPIEICKFVFAKLQSLDSF